MAKRMILDGTEEVVDSTPSIMEPKIISFLIVGRSPLLQNNPANFIGVDEGTQLSAGKKKYNDAEEARLRVYLDPNGAYCHPCESFTKAMVKAASGKKFGKMFATQMLKGSVFIVEPYALIEDESGQPATEYSLDRRSVVIGKARVLRCRPCWNKWRMRVPFEVDTAMLRPDQILEMLMLAGRIIGVGDFRPEKGGGFGRFTAELL